MGRGPLLTTSEVSALTGASYRQLDYWDRTGVVFPDVPACGSGTRRRYTAAQAAVAHVVARLAALGCHGHVLRAAAEQLADADAAMWRGWAIVDPDGTVLPIGDWLGGWTDGWIVDLSAADRAASTGRLPLAVA